jgi:hypothetical protein
MLGPGRWERNGRWHTLTQSRAPRAAGTGYTVQGSERWRCHDGTLNHGAVPSPMKKERVVCDICAVRMSTAPYQ